MRIYVENKIVTDAIDPNPIPVKYISFATFGSSAADVYSNCPGFSGSRLDYDYIQGKMNNASGSQLCVPQFAIMLLSFFWVLFK